jgi:hypothetical protein
VTTRCRACHRPLKQPTESGMGRVCASRAAPAPAVERDLFGFDIERACAAALDRLEQQLDFAAWLAHDETRKAIRRAKEEAWGRWAA